MRNFLWCLFLGAGRIKGGIDAGDQNQRYHVQETFFFLSEFPCTTFGLRVLYTKLTLWCFSLSETQNQTVALKEINSNVGRNRRIGEAIIHSIQSDNLDRKHFPPFNKRDVCLL